MSAADDRARRRQRQATTTIARWKENNMELLVVKWSADDLRPRKKGRLMV